MGSLVEKAVDMAGASGKDRKRESEKERDRE